MGITHSTLFNKESKRLRVIGYFRMASKPPIEIKGPSRSIAAPSLQTAYGVGAPPWAALAEKPIAFRIHPDPSKAKEIASRIERLNTAE